MSNSFDPGLRTGADTLPILEQQLDIAASPAAVWSVLRDFGDVDKWAPYMRRSRSAGSTRSGLGSSRVLHHFWGFRLVETATEWCEGTGFSFDVLGVPFPLADVHETWKVGPSSYSATVTTRVQYRVRLGRLGKLIDRACIGFLVRREMQSGLRGLKQYVESGTHSSTANNR
jgi:hypothetical protein